MFVKNTTYIFEGWHRAYYMTDWMSTPITAGCDENWSENLRNFLAEKEWSSSLLPIVSKLSLGERLSIDDGHILYSHPNLNEIGQLANLVKLARYDTKVFFNSNVHINQTNICVLACKFCAFRRSKRQSDAYELSLDHYLLEMVHKP